MSYVTAPLEKMADPMCGKSCPKCRSERYYWLKSSGRCFECGFHWGVEKPTSYKAEEVHCKAKL